MKFDGCVEQLGRLSRGSGKLFSHADLVVTGYDPVRVDDFFEAQVSRALSSADTAATAFSGESFVAFDGEIKEVDLRGSVPRLKLILTAGRREIDCIYPNATVEELRLYLDRRVVVSGFGFFDGVSGLPIRLRIQSIVPVKKNGDVSRWRGTFTPFAIEEWETAE
jgi:hypothetical protein